MRAGFVALAVLGCSLAGCYASASSSGRARPVQRVAAQDQAIRALLLDIAAPRICEQLEGTFVALPDQGAADGGSAPAGGRLWVEGCAADVTAEGQLDLQLRGRGWSWADQSSGGFFSFAVRQYVRFDASIHMLGAADIGYERSQRLVSVWLSSAPGTLPGVQMQVHGPISASPETLGAMIASVFVDEDAQARSQAATQGAEQFQQRLAGGFTVTMDLCSGQRDHLVGALALGQRAQRPYPEDGTIWLENQRVHLRHGGLDAAGPWRAPEARPVRVELAVEAGGPLLVSTPCVADAQRMVTSFFSGEIPESADGSAPQTVMTSTTLELPAGGCPRVLVAVPAGTEDAVYRYRASVPGAARAEPPLRCAGAPGAGR